MKLISLINFWNLWLPFLANSLIYLIGVKLVDRKRATPILDPEFRIIYPQFSGIVFFLFYILILFPSFIISLRADIYFYVGIGINILAILLMIFSMIQISKSDRFYFTGGIYNFSRNPLYLSHYLYIVGLNFMCFDLSSWQYLFFSGISITAIIMTHSMIIKMEEFFIHKYKSAYINYERQVRRYLTFSSRQMETTS